jgi:hypothetical protein
MQFNGSRREGLSLIEVLAVIVTVMLVLAVLPAILGHRHKPRHGITCVTNLKQVALASRMWSNDHSDRFPWQVSTNEGGTLEFAASPEVFRHFEAMSNEMVTPRILICPRDPERLRATSFAPSLANSNLSYFIGLDANETKPQSILSGDRNLMGGVTNGALLSFRSNDVPQWASSIHTNQGNLALGDGSAQYQLTDQALARQFQTTFVAQASMTTLRLAIPRTPQDALVGKRVESSPRSLTPWVTALAVATAVFGGWWLLRRRLLAGAIEPPQSP